ncbi:uncharacterized protein EI90DRAFT_3076284 [Cantharellus anzutake]|uniref:uncharacterized protein n=1 Tax=Cantharellus anzutake TaxID=1750568 RepID=UPI001902D589|nr:uncharacterized protein EI90DRAFT_3076284 [Cantharellus anzutake]KAF8324205.1 hypothetical protein EI90DRAFT_3076284 [Cantharellus anzutake]
MAASEQRRGPTGGLFCGDYRGDNVQILPQALGVYDKIYDSTLYYGRSIPIFQSSGTGKSHLVAEVLKNTPGLSICFRDSSSPEVGWPPRDEAMCRFVKSVEYLVCLINRGQGNTLAGPVRGQKWPLPLSGHFLGRSTNASVEIQMTILRRQCLPGHKSVSRGVSFESVFEAANRSLATMPDELVARRQRTKTLMRSMNGIRSCADTFA